MKLPDTLARNATLVTCILALGGLVPAHRVPNKLTAQVLPGPWSGRSSAEYFAPGPEFKLSRQAKAESAPAGEALRATE